MTSDEELVMYNTDHLKLGHVTKLSPMAIFPRTGPISSSVRTGRVRPG